MNNLPEKTLVEFGFPLLDELVEKGRKENENKVETNKKEILIAPSWQEDNLLDSVIDELIKALYKDEYKLIVRPHPEYVKRYGASLNALVKKYENYDKEKLVFELDFSSNESIYTSDLIITDWSGIAPEFCFATLRPAVFINTKIKASNENWKKIDKVPVEISLRKVLGKDVEKQDVKDIDKVVSELFIKGKEYQTAIKNAFDNLVYNHGTASVKGAKYILYSLKNKRENQTVVSKKGE
jgi:YidC/Oxa1 family membrane protein insertase